QGSIACSSKPTRVRRQSVKFTSTLSIPLLSQQIALQQFGATRAERRLCASSLVETRARPSSAHTQPWSGATKLSQKAGRGSRLSPMHSLANAEHLDSI